jgi:hypothetical protein
MCLIKWMTKTQHRDLATTLLEQEFRLRATRYSIMKHRSMHDAQSLGGELLISRVKRRRLRPTLTFSHTERRSNAQPAVVPSGNPSATFYSCRQVVQVSEEELYSQVLVQGPCSCERLLYQAARRNMCQIRSNWLHCTCSTSTRVVPKIA